MEFANCLSIPILTSFVHFFHFSAQAGDDGEVQGDDGSAAACSTEYSGPTAIKLGVMVLQGVQQLSVHLGLRRDSHLTGY